MGHLIMRVRRRDSGQTARSAGFLFCLPILGLLSFLAPQTAAQPSTDEASQINIFCPILPDEKALEEFTVEHEGKKVALCCRSCLHQFQANPDAYLHALPQFADSVPRAAGVDWRALAEKLPGWRPIVVLLLILALLVIVDRRLRQTNDGRGLLDRLVANRQGTSTALVLVLLVIAGAAGWKNRQLRQELGEVERELRLAEREKTIHNNTFVDYGFPPKPARPRVPPRLAASFYRGNDERNPQLFNGGHYRTARFNLAVELGDGTPVQVGDTIAAELLVLSMELERAPYTPDFFFGPEIMNAIFLTRQTDRFLGFERPVLDRVGLTNVEPMQRWQAHFPLGRFDSEGDGEQRLDGVIYVADEWLEGDRMIGASLHYGIEYDIAAKNGVVQETSDLWMGALFRPRKTPLSKIPQEEWFSHEPIPELPAPNPDDPKLLGTEDYVTDAASRG